MPFDAEQLMAYAIPEARQALTRRDCMLYALGIGVGDEPTSEHQLRFVYEPHLRAMPTMANVLAHPGFWMKAAETGMDWRRILHGEQKFTIHKPLPVEANLVGRTHVKAIADRGAGKGAYVYLERHVVDADSGDAVCTLEQTTVCRGDGGCGSIGEVERTRRAIPVREPDHLCDLTTLPQAALLYRLNGDMNPLHADPEVARSAGYDRPILHGLCTFGVAGHAILRICCDYEPDRISSMSVRFTAPVFPGETIRTEMWHVDEGLSFRSRVLERDAVVLGSGWVEFND
ncbi:MAG: 3-alpha,7-alpha,12-alpha-trihydroxy-5-beta-cholest-24-enoyl-CoA hydratase [Gammaproteobacteria bacterium]|nr:3-alpha,7-alpha,12-alpha-trihydroxy-5-beta-cholest-24-enoyl-CoA hydratase [Gammaproteobacteria bacterium]NIM74350.1 3-alpha,7-alpha,12-alpha-trihydroxy-5-beta-cholest-24-enoyl-CoA hydratase [Gammaproteobacteria bacterium]NIO26122.1 3-alpha,7-alpha,12-alpha-trihydroxy-5-beta-cholest-24-enoyl-CoA hydratase [Gammaproteobacteria bacterium]NIO66735.1 3-alpha,7-alpha,12-alpha-trihydroxy-5-beta-cholest-24-enoyl-CoA hydratase [Gammaproteobacteria bacterium]NIP65888.1 3-alpha,7-alpha,12-alpha-trihydr